MSFLDAAGTAGKAAQTILGVFGKKTSPDVVAARLARDAGHRAARGDRSAVAYLTSSLASKYERKRKAALGYLQQLASGTMIGGGGGIAVGQRVAPAVQAEAQKALQQLGLAGTTSIYDLPAQPDNDFGGDAQWTDDSGIPAPVAGPSKAPRPKKKSAKPAPPAKNGYEISPFKAPGAKPPCKYGPRGPDGLCPKKPTGLTAGKLTKGQSKLLKRAETTAYNVLKKGALGATAAIGAGIKAVGGAGAVAGAGALAAVAAAGAFGWILGQEILHAGETKQARMAAAAVDRVHARAALAKILGYLPSLAEQKPITEAYNRRLYLIKTGLT